MRCKIERIQTQPWGARHLWYFESVARPPVKAKFITTLHCFSHPGLENQTCDSQVVLHGVLVQTGFLPGQQATGQQKWASADCVCRQSLAGQQSFFWSFRHAIFLVIWLAPSRRWPGAWARQGTSRSPRQHPSQGPCPSSALLEPCVRIFWSDSWAETWHTTTSVFKLRQHPAFSSKKVGPRPMEEQQHPTLAKGLSLR